MSETTQSSSSEKTFLATWLFAWLLGSLGVDRFYLGKTGSGIAKLLTLGGCGIWALIDLILVLSGSTKDSQGLTLAGYSEHKTMAIWVTVGVTIAGTVIYWFIFGSLFALSAISG